MHSNNNLKDKVDKTTDFLRKVVDEVLDGETIAVCVIAKKNENGAYVLSTYSTDWLSNLCLLEMAVSDIRRGIDDDGE